MGAVASLWGYEYGIDVNPDICATCRMCEKACPFNAIAYNEETERMEVDIERCQMCAVCYSTCPASAIQYLYFNLASIENSLELSTAPKIAIACRGNVPSEEDLMHRLGVSGEELRKDYFTMLLPCVGRLRAEFLIDAVISRGRKVVLMPCDEDFCRFVRGSEALSKKVQMLKRIFSSFGISPDVIEVHRDALKVVFKPYRCLGCAECQAFCPTGAARVIPPGPVADFDIEKCKGCGICAAVCPAHAVDLRGWEFDRISEKIHEIAQEKKPKILVFCCQWCEFGAFNRIEEISEEGIEIILMPCSGRVDPLHVIQAIYEGIKGVMIAACPEEECKLDEGSKTALYFTMERLKEVLSQLNIEKRVRICFTSPKYIGKFEEEIQKFLKEIEEME